MSLPPRRRPSSRALGALLALALATSCGPTALRPERSSPSVSLGGAGSRRVETLTDLEETRGIARAGGMLYVATDAGLLRYDDSGAPGRAVEGLPSEDVRAVAVDANGVLAATAAGMVRVEADEVTPVSGVPDIGHLTDMARAADETIWLCGLGGVARSVSAGWEIFGEPVRCTDLAPTPEGQLWVGTTEGLWYVEDDVIREHPIGGGMPEGYVREIVPVLPGQILAILQGPNDARIGYWDSERWYGYTLAGLEGQAVGLVRRGHDVLLVSQNRVLELAPRGAGVSLIPLSASEGRVRSFRARTAPGAEHQPGQLPSAEILQEPQRLAEVPANRPSIDAPPFKARPLEVELPGRAYAAFVQGSDAFVAIANGGVLELPSEGRAVVHRSRTLVPETDLQIATDAGGTVWTLSRDANLAKFVNDRLRVSRLPEGHVAQALADGPQGAYLVTREPSAGDNAVRIFSNAGRGWSPLAERELELPTELTGVPFAGVDNDGKVWLALRVVREDQGGERLRGVAVIDPSSEAVVYHHRGADRSQGGVPLPDEVHAVDFDTDGNAWFATLSGLVRVGASQAVVFGEARGVRGEIVSDVVVGSGVIWLASGEGLGSYDRSSFDYGQPEWVQDARPTQLAMDMSGHLWASSDEGLILHEAEQWVMLDRDDGLPRHELRDVEVDEAGRVWLLAEDQVMVLER